MIRLVLLRLLVFCFFATFLGILDTAARNFLVNLGVKCWRYLYSCSKVGMRTQVLLHGFFFPTLAIPFLGADLMALLWGLIILVFFEIPFRIQRWSIIFFVLLFWTAYNFIWSGVPRPCSHANYLRRDLMLLFLTGIILGYLQLILFDDSYSNGLC